MNRRTPALATSAMALGTLVALMAPAATTSAGHPAPSLQQLIDNASTGSLPFSPELAAVSCPVERGPVKQGSDADRAKVSTTVNRTTIAYLGIRPKPSSYPKNNRIAPYELKTWQIDGLLTQYKQEADGDLHLIVRDSGGRTMIAEIPYPSCVPSASRWKSLITSARSTFTHAYAASTSWRTANRSITVRGLVMFDPLHGQSGAAKNGIELHPVIGVAFHGVAPTAPTPSPTATAASPSPTPSTTTAPGCSAGQTTCVTSIIDPISHGATEHLTASTSPSTNCTLSITLPSGATSTSSGLGSATSDSSGQVSWTWTIGSNTSPGSAQAHLSCGGSQVLRTFTIN
jgi:hypothetical protein